MHRNEIRGENGGLPTGSVLVPGGELTGEAMNPIFRRRCGGGVARGHGRRSTQIDEFPRNGRWVDLNRAEGKAASRRPAVLG